MRIGLYGGSFDPIHRGHVDTVVEAMNALDLDRVFYLPTAEPPHKGPRSAPAHRRFTMVELALLEHSNLQVSDFELTPGHIAFTVETVRHFAAEYPGASLYLILGSDGFLQFKSWRRWQEIAECTTLVVLARPDWLAGRRGELPAELEELVVSGSVRFVENRPVPLASRAIRASIAAGETVADGVLAPLVLDYLRKYDLYR